MSASTDDTLPMTPFSEWYAVSRRIQVPLSSDDSTVEIPLSRRIRRESPILSPDSPDDVLVLGHSSSSLPMLTSQRRSTEDATLSNVASPSTTQLATMSLSPQHMLAYAKKWQDYFESMLSNQNGLRDYMALKIAKMDGTICRLDATIITAYEPSQANSMNDLPKLEEDLTALDNFTGTSTQASSMHRSWIKYPPKACIFDLEEFGTHLQLNRNIWENCTGKFQVS